MALVTSSCEGVGSDSLPDDRLRVFLVVGVQVVVRDALGRGLVVTRSVVVGRDVPVLDDPRFGSSLIVPACDPVEIRPGAPPSISIG